MRHVGLSKPHIHVIGLLWSQWYEILRLIWETYNSPAPGVLIFETCGTLATKVLIYETLF